MAWVRVAQHEGGLAFVELDIVERKVHGIRVHNETNRVLVISARETSGPRAQITREFLAPGGIEVTRAVPPSLRNRLDVGTPEEPPVIPATFAISTNLLAPGQDESAIT